MGLRPWEYARMQPIDVLEMEEGARWQWGQRAVLVAQLLMPNAKAETSFDEMLLSVFYSDQDLKALPEFKR